ncbi:hypothetical protein AMS68_001733 [Peltaster fructicola]|uniref:ATP synthase mitochondrial F1 complex assembly factor 2 n=1 Tax=Peltaster fructicola TaxID=286661 RepID=A0A6H0XND5_9PEZI|nr:hypothetical protein AMS68_001733 [Peltaster fructicola]
MKRTVVRASRLASPQCAPSTTAVCRLQRLQQGRCMSNSLAAAATPVAHPTVAGAPPPPPQQSVTYVGDRLNRKRAQAEALQRGQQKKVDPSKPGSALSRRFWKDVSVQEAQDGLQVHLDKRAVRTSNKQPLSLPHEKRMLASAIALEWDQLVSAQQALKHHYIPLTALVSRAIDIQAADAAGNTTIRESISKMLMRYLSTDTLLCWAPERDIHDPENRSGRRSLRGRQKEIAEPIIAYLKAHVFPGIEIEPILSEDSIVPRSHPELTVEVIRGWVNGLPAYELAALERGVLATKSLLIAARLVVEWSTEFQELPKGSVQERFGIENAAEASTLEEAYQTEQWGEVEDTHDVNAADLRRQLGSVILLIS